MRRRMNIYITTGKRNLKYAYVAIKSLFMNNQSSEVYLYVVSEDLTMEDMVYENELAERYGHRIIILRFDEEMASKQIHLDAGDHWPIGTMSSYWLFHELLPEDVDRVMVIESDTVIVGDLSEIYNMEFEGAYVICPGPEHKPANHRNFMKSIGGECLTFVLSMYDVSGIRRDFTLKDILDMDDRIKKLAGYSQMEFTFGMLFKGKIKYVPGPESCIDENERYVEELGYDYIVQCEKTAKILHFSSYSDYSKPWNPVSMMPGYAVWWEYAKGSPYYKEYFEAQWQIYAKSREKIEQIRKNISYRNILLCTLLLACMGTGAYEISLGEGPIGMVIVIAIFGLSFLISIGVREAGKFVIARSRK